MEPDPSAADAPALDSPRMRGASLPGGGRCVIRASLLLALCVLPACSDSILSVLPVRSAPAPEIAPVAVAVDSTSVHLPMKVSGTAVAYGDVDRALLRSVERAVARVAPRLSVSPGQRLDLTVELIEAHSEYIGGRLLVRLDTRATLRRARGNAYVAQTHAHAGDSRHARLVDGGTAVIACTDAIGAQLAGWLLGLELRS